MLRKTKKDDVTPAKAGVQSEKAGFPLEFIPHTMRGGNDRYSFRNRKQLFFLLTFTMFKKPIIKLLVIVCFGPGVMSGIGIDR